jgi:hypothetical protein
VRFPLIYLFAAILVIGVALAVRRLLRRKKLRISGTSRHSDYLLLRQQALTGLRGKVGLSVPSQADKSYAVLMDWNVGSGVATVVAVADGSASIYLSNGGGSMGGGQADTAIRDAALRAVAIARNSLPHMSKTEEFPLPEARHVCFYAINNNGVFGLSVLTQDLIDGAHPLSALGNVMQEIITRYRALPAAR